MTGEKDLAAAVIQQALEDFRNTDITKKRDRETARAFLHGGPGSLLEFWCEAAGIDRRAMQDKIFPKKATKVSAQCLVI